MINHQDILDGERFADALTDWYLFSIGGLISSSTIVSLTRLRRPLRQLIRGIQKASDTQIGHDRSHT